jgi:hypothetical protein
MNYLGVFYFMPIDWSLLYTKGGNNNKAGKLFEKLALKYVQSVYPQYTWEPTNESWDGNRDFYFADKEDRGWGEAKYRKNSDEVTKKDLDPTIVSGWLDGKVKLILFITNGYISQNNIERIAYAARIQNIKVGCIFQEQLEHWLILNPNIYKEFFSKPLKATAKTDATIIKEISFYNPYSSDFNPFGKSHELRIGNEYILNITISSNTRTYLSLIANDYPFLVIQHPNFDFPDKIGIEKGINICFIYIKALREHIGFVDFKFLNERGTTFTFLADIKIIDEFRPTLVYSQQNMIINETAEYIQNTNSDNSKCIIVITGKSGIGKSHILEAVFKNYCIKHDVNIIRFDAKDESNENYLLLCRIIMFLNYGNLFWFDTQKNKDILLNRNTKALFQNEVLERLIDGCNDANEAKCIINDLNNDLKNKEFPIISSTKNTYFKNLYSQPCRHSEFYCGEI